MMSSLGQKRKVRKRSASSLIDSCFTPGVINMKRVLCAMVEKCMSLNVASKHTQWYRSKERYSFFVILRLHVEVDQTCGQFVIGELGLGFVLR